MRTSKVLALLAEQERKFDRERQASGRSGAPARPHHAAGGQADVRHVGPRRRSPEDPDLMDPTAHLGEDLMDLLA